MPIRGVSTREHLKPTLPTGGKLRKGSPKVDGKMGHDLTYFRFTSNNPEIAEAFRTAYGDEPDSLEVYLPEDTLEQVFSSWREIYGQNGLVRVRCDGANWINWIDGSRYVRAEPGEHPCPLEVRDTANRCPLCKAVPVGRLSVILPDLLRAGHVVQVTMETHGWNDIGTISAQLVKYEPLTGKLFRLYRETARVGAPVKDKRVAVDKSLVRIELASAWAQRQIAAQEREAMRLLGGGDEWPGQPERVEPEDLDDLTIDAVAEVVEPPATEPAEPDTVEYLGETQTRTLTEAEARKLLALTRGTLILTDGEVLKALGVERLGEYPGSYEDAVAACEAFLKEVTRG